MNFSDKTNIERARDMYQWHRQRMFLDSMDAPKVVLHPHLARLNANRVPYEHYRKVMRKLIIEKLFFILSTF